MTPTTPHPPSELIAATEVTTLAEKYGVAPGLVASLLLTHAVMFMTFIAGRRAAIKSLRHAIADVRAGKYPEPDRGDG